MHILLIIIFIIVFTNVFVRAAKLINIPIVVALIISGLILGLPYFKDFLNTNDAEIIYILGDIALLSLMFLAGMETKSSLLKKEFKEAAPISICASLTPFLLGLVTFKILGYTWLTSLIIGICMSITAEATQAKVLIDLKKLKTRIGTLTMEAGIIDDILGFSIFILATILMHDVNLREDLMLAAVIFSFFVGVLLRKNMGRDHKHINRIEKFLLNLVVPFFFISMGMHFDFTSLVLSPITLIIIVFIAFFGKIFGTFIAKPFGDLKWKQLHLIGWAMNSRGALGLALALIAYKAELIPVGIYSSLVLMALITTITFPFVVSKMVKKNPRIMD